MTRRQKKRAWVFAGVFSTLLGAGVLIGNVYARAWRRSRRKVVPRRRYRMCWKQ